MWIKCPECGTELEVPDNHPSRPFCSPRCKLIDLGNWFDEKYRLPGPPAMTPVPEEPSLTVDVDRFQIPEA